MPSRSRTVPGTTSPGPPTTITTTITTPRDGPPTTMTTPRASAYPHLFPRSSSSFVAVLTPSPSPCSDWFALSVPEWNCDHAQCRLSLFIFSPWSSRAQQIYTLLYLWYTIFMVSASHNIHGRSCQHWTPQKAEMSRKDPNRAEGRNVSRWLLKGVGPRYTASCLLCDARVRAKVCVGIIVYWRNIMGCFDEREYWQMSIWRL